MVERIAVSGFKRYAVNLEHLDQIAAARDHGIIIHMPGIRQSISGTRIKLRGFL